MKFLVIVSVLASVFATCVSDKLEWQSGSYCMANTEISLASRSAFVTYPGLPADVAGEKSTVEVKIYRDKANLVHTFKIPDDDKNKPKMFWLALDGATEGGYSSQICVKDDSTSEKCSHQSSPLSRIDTGTNKDSGKNHELECTRTTKNNVQKILKAELKSVTGYASNDILTTLKQNTRSLISIHGFSSNKETKMIGNQKMLYFAITYPVKEFREFAKMKDFCMRKYRPVLLTYIVDKKTKEVLTKGRDSPVMPESYIETYLGLKNETDPTTGEFLETGESTVDLPEVPIELLVKVDCLELGTYNAWHIACMVRKDGSEEVITHCAVPYVAEVAIKPISD